jgi:hypothetical protein
LSKGEPATIYMERRARKESKDIEKRIGLKDIVERTLLVLYRRPFEIGLLRLQSCGTFVRPATIMSHVSKLLNVLASGFIAAGQRRPL